MGAHEVSDRDDRGGGLTAAAAADLFRRAPDRFLDVGIGEVAYRQVGTGPDVLFVHGWPVSGATFRCLLPYLADHVTCHVIDLPGAGSSRFTGRTPVSFDNHIRSVRRVVDLLGLESVVAVGHDSGGLIVRHALADDDRLRALVLIDTEQSTGVSLKFRTFVAGRRIPGFGHALAWLAGRPRLRRNGLVFGDAFVDRSHLDGEFAEFFLEPLHGSPDHRRAASRILRSFGYRYLRGLDELHGRIRVPVHLIWGEADRFFPVARAADMVGSFPDARLTVIEGAGLFAHEERPAEVAAALLTTVTGSESA